MTAIFSKFSPTPDSGHAMRSGHRLYRDMFKRWLDVGLVVLALPAALSLIAVFALLIALDGHNPFYRQRRVGRDGRIFALWKLRTMVPNAERLLDLHLQTNAERRREWEAHQKLRHDPRITPIGRLLRRCSLDELPQLWNVLKGDMSLVGPRPMMPCQQVLYPGNAYYNLRPGITGFWQISRRHDTAFAERAEFDTAYERAVSPGTDLRVLLSTVGVVLRGTGV
jgi:exopolysaccharide production protein ExoY